MLKILFNSFNEGTYKMLQLVQVQTHLQIRNNGINVQIEAKLASSIVGEGSQFKIHEGEWGR